MPYCVLRYCHNSSRNVKKADGISFHRFLRPGHEKREAWITFVQNERSEDHWLPSKSSSLCSLHFREEDFDEKATGRKFLKKGAVPYTPALNNQNSRTPSPSSLVNEYISDSDSIFDTPTMIQLKLDLKNEVTKNEQLAIKVKKLTRQKNYIKREYESLKNKYKSLQKIVKTLNKKEWKNIKKEIIKNIKKE